MATRKAEPKEYYYLGGISGAEDLTNDSFFDTLEELVEAMAPDEGDQVSVVIVKRVGKLQKGKYILVDF